MGRGVGGYTATGESYYHGKNNGYLVVEKNLYSAEK